ncbi:MAG: hypothetical protein LBG11_09215 [Bifidobacteriaceae bacterium]|jgi:hypothetical protein|nr:hypothetical protein [Bifidobacteriaceae bacterium]
MVALITTYSETSIGRPAEAPLEYPTYDGLYTASSSSNQYIFVLDLDLARGEARGAPEANGQPQLKA